MEAVARGRPRVWRRRHLLEERRFLAPALIAPAGLFMLVVVAGAAVLSHVLVKNFRGKWLFRLLILLPWAAPLSLSTLGWQFILDSTYSVVNWTLTKLHLLGAVCWAVGAPHGCNGLNPPQWLGRPNLAL